jgi:hypothetical protein
MRAFMNRIVNPFVRVVLKSRWHGLLGDGLALLVVRGRRSGRLMEVPIEVHTVHGDLIAVTFRARTWWRNFREQTATTLWLHGQPADVTVQVAEDPRAVKTWLAGLLSEKPASAAYLKVSRDSAGEARRAELGAAAQPRVIAVIRALSCR